MQDGAESLEGTGGIVISPYRFSDAILVPVWFGLAWFSSSCLVRSLRPIN